MKNPRPLRMFLLHHTFNVFLMSFRVADKEPLLHVGWARLLDARWQRERGRHCPLTPEATDTAGRRSAPSERGKHNRWKDSDRENPKCGKQAALRPREKSRGVCEKGTERQRAERAQRRQRPVGELLESAATPVGGAEGMPGL